MTDHESRTLTRTDCLLIAALIALVLPLRLWLLYNTEVTARDSIGYIRYALQFEQKDWKKVLQNNHQHPGFPVSVWLMSLAVRAVDGETTPENMELSTQLVNFVAALLLILPMYLLGRQFFDRSVSFGAALLYQFLPISAQHLSDGISEPLYLVFLVTGLWQMALAIRDRRIVNCVLCGLFAGLAYLTRPEGLLIVPAFGLTLLALQMLPAQRCGWGRFLACGIGGVGTALLVGAVYVYATGHLSNKPTANVITHIAEASPPHASFLFAETFPLTGGVPLRLLKSGRALAMEVTQGLHYAGVLAALLGFCWAFGELRRHANFWALMVYAAIHVLILLALAMKAGYISDRHVMILVAGSCYFVVFALCEGPRRALAYWNLPAQPVPSWRYSAPVWFAILFVTLIGFCLPKATQRLHGNRVGNHLAGLWLAEHVKVGDVIEDDHAWSHFFSGVFLQEGRERPLPSDCQPFCYVVTTRSSDPLVDKQRTSKQIAEGAKVVFAWPNERQPRVVVRVQARDYATHPWRIASP